MVTLDGPKLDVAIEFRNKPGEKAFRTTVRQIKNSKLAWSLDTVFMYHRCLEPEVDRNLEWIPRMQS